jgi:hypothetical protein
MHSGNRGALSAANGCLIGNYGSLRDYDNCLTGPTSFDQQSVEVQPTPLVAPP